MNAYEINNHGIKTYFMSDAEESFDNVKKLDNIITVAQAFRSENDQDGDVENVIIFCDGEKIIIEGETAEHQFSNVAYSVEEVAEKLEKENFIKISSNLKSDVIKKFTDLGYGIRYFSDTSNEKFTEIIKGGKGFYYQKHLSNSEISDILNNLNGDGISSF